MNNTNIISGKEFKEAIKVGDKFHSIEYCLDKKKQLNAANYIGFSTLKFGKNSFIVYTMKLNINDIIINENNISGFFIHSIYDVILDECDKYNKEYLSYGNKNKNKINIICKEYFEGIWFAKENRMLIYGTLLECADKEVPIGKENYDIYITDNYIIGKWAFRKATKHRDG